MRLQYEMHPAGAHAPSDLRDRLVPGFSGQKGEAGDHRHSITRLKAEI